MRSITRLLSAGSLKRYLFLWLLAVQTAGWLVLIASAWWTGHHEAEEVSDGQLIAVARAWLAMPPERLHQGYVKHSPPERVQDYVQDVAILRWLNGALTTNTDGLDHAQMPPLPLGLSTVHIKSQGYEGDWRTYTVEQMTPQGLDRLVVLMHMEHRIELAHDMAIHTLYPALLALPLSIVLMMLALTRGIQPLDKLSAHIAALGRRTHERLSPDHGFSEFDSTVSALNGLMDRLDAQLAQEKAFASDVAHELRTPLAALSINAGRIVTEHPSPETHALEQDALRTGAILQQLVTLARAESRQLGKASELNLHACAAQVMAETGQMALESGHTLELLETPQTITVQADAMAVELAFSNVLRNALLHTPAGSHVQVCVFASERGRGIQVEDLPRKDTGDLPKPKESLGLGLRLVERLMRSQNGQLHVQQKTDSGRIVRLLWTVDA